MVWDKHVAMVSVKIMQTYTYFKILSFQPKDDTETSFHLTL